jgi:DNA-binding IclR family transcriptional regulator
MGNGEEQDSRYRVNVVDRAIQVLKAFDQQHPRLTLSEIAARAGLPVSTCLRLLATLRHHGLVSRDEESGRFSLGYEIIALADIARSGGGLVEWARPVMHELCGAFQETVVLSVRSGDFRIDLDQVVGQQNVRRVIALGERKPLYAGAASQVLLSGFSEAELDDYLARVRPVKLAEHTITDPEELRRLIVRIRRDGVVESIQQQSESGGAGVAAGIFGARDEMVGAIGISVPQYRFTPTLRRTLAPAVKAAADRISRVLGGHGRRIA